MSNYDFIKALKLLEGDNFSKEELRQRLHSMNINYSISDNRKELINVYNNAIKNIDYVVKIIDKIKIDHSISSIPISKHPADSKIVVSTPVIKNDAFIKEFKLPKSTKLVNNISDTDVPLSNEQFNQEIKKYANDHTSFTEESKKHYEEMNKFVNQSKPQPISQIYNIKKIMENNELNTINLSLNSISLSNDESLSSKEKELSQEKVNTFNIFGLSKIAKTSNTKPETDHETATLIRNHEVLNDRINEFKSKEDSSFIKKLISEKYSKDFLPKRPKSFQPGVLRDTELKYDKKVNELNTSEQDFTMNHILNSKEEVVDSSSIGNSKLNIDNPQHNEDDSYSIFTKSLVLLLGAGIAYAGYRMITYNNDLFVDFVDNDFVPFNFNPLLINQPVNTDLDVQLTDSIPITNNDTIINNEQAQSSLITSSITGLFTSIIKFRSAITTSTSYIINNGVLGSLSNLLLSGFEYTFGFMFNNIIYISIGFLFVLLYFKLKSIYSNRSLSNKIFMQIRDRLKLISDLSNSFDHGISQESIINEYASENNISEQEFSERILPQLLALRKKESKMREFYKDSNGKIKLYWQWN